jgi:hypothetical protein
MCEYCGEAFRDGDDARPGLVGFVHWDCEMLAQALEATAGDGLENAE